MIRFGPSGIPLSCKGRTLPDAVKDVHHLGLTALEVQLVRTNLIERYALNDEKGKPAYEAEEGIIVSVVRGKGKNKKEIPLDQPLEDRDIVMALMSNIVKNYGQLKVIGEVAKELDVKLSVHAPYYVELTGSENNPLTKKTIDSIKWAGLMSKAMDGTIVVTHIGLYGSRGKKKSYENARSNLKNIMDWYKKNNIDIYLGIEMSGKQEIFGTLEECLGLAKDVPGVLPVVNFPHYHARTGGSLREKEDFSELLDTIFKVTKDAPIYTHFSGVEHDGGNEKRLTPIKKGDLRFDPLAECIIERNLDLTVISSSPLREHDAMYMKVIFERILSRHLSKRKKKEKEKDAVKEVKKEEKTGKDRKKTGKKTSKSKKKTQSKSSSKGKSASSKSTSKSKPSSGKSSKSSTSKSSKSSTGKSSKSSSGKSSKSSSKTTSKGSKSSKSSPKSKGSSKGKGKSKSAGKSTAKKKSKGKSTEKGAKSTKSTSGKGTSTKKK